MTDVVLALDIGTSSSRVMLYDLNAEPVAGAKFQREYKPHVDQSGAAEFNVEVWMAEVTACLDEAHRHCQEHNLSPVAVGCTTFWHSMVGMDDVGRPVTPLITWADTRPDDTLDSLYPLLDPDQLHARTGCALHSSYFPARLWWLKQTSPALCGAASRFVSPGEFLYRQWFGRAACSVSMASATGLFNQNTCDWDAETLSVLGIGPENLGDLSDLDSPISGLLEAWRRKWPLFSDIPWAPAIGDGAAGNLGSGCVSRDRVAINLGTSGAIRVCFAADRLTIPPDLWCYRLDRERYVMGAAFSDGGDAVDWLYDTVQLPEKAEADAELSSRARDSHGLTLLPFLLGERSLGWRPNATAAFHGLRRSTEPLDLLQCVMEGVSHRYGLAYQTLKPHLAANHSILAGGGALQRWSSWRNILADALGHDIVVTDNAETTSRGAALCALRVLGEAGWFSNPPAPNGQVVDHNEQNEGVMKKARDRQQRLYRAIVNFDAETSSQSSA